MNTSANENLNNANSLSEDIVSIKDIEKRLFVINEENFKNPNCIDWRDDNIARPSIAWWKIWALMAIMKSLDDLNIKDKSKREQITSFLKEYFNWFSFHSDTHVESCDCKWCGHIKHWLFESIEDYWLSEDSINIVKEAIWSVDNSEIDTLEWNHQEQAVVIVDSAEYWVKSQHEWKQFFVYNTWYAKKLYKDIAEKLEENWIIESGKSLWNNFFETWHNQFLTTWWKLAKWLPIYEVKINEEWEVVSLSNIWKVESDDSKEAKDRVDEIILK